jgi:fumarate reductase subunit D
MIPASRRQPGFVAALLHRLSGLALAIFLPLHFYALGLALNRSDRFATFFQATNTPLVKTAEFVIVVALATHMALGLRVLAVEFLAVREHTAAAVSICLGAAFAIGVVFLLNVQ